MTGRFKKFVSIIISLMVVCSAFGLYASAGNTALSEYSYALSPTAGYRHTPPLISKLTEHIMHTIPMKSMI